MKTSIEYTGDGKVMINGKEIKAIFTDGDDTLIRFKENHNLALEYARSRVYKNPWRKFIIPFIWILERMALAVKDTGFVSATETGLKLLLVLEAILLFTNIKKFKKRYFEKYNSLDFEIIEVLETGELLKATEVIEEIRKKYRIFATSNNSQNFKFFLEQGLNEKNIYTPALRKSKKLLGKVLKKGAKKPELYIQALADNGLKPDEVLVIGDSIRDDIKKAKEVGCHTLLLNPEASIEISIWCGADIFSKSFSDMLKIIVK